MVQYIKRYLKRKLTKYILRSFQKDIYGTRRELSKQEEDILLSGMWQNQAFRNWVYDEENKLTLAMANEGVKPSDEQYDTWLGMRLKLADLNQKARSAHKRHEKEINKRKKQDALAKEEKETSQSPQV